MNIFMLIFYVVPELLLGVLLVGAKLEELLNPPWKIVFIPFYIAALALLGLVIVDERLRRRTGNGGFWKIVIQLFAWLLIVIFLGLLVSKLDTVEGSFSWSLTLGPLIIATAICAVFEFTSYFVTGMKTYNVLITRVNKQHILLWFVAEVGILIFLFLLGLKLDMLEMDTDQGFILAWGWVFLPLWISFAFAIPVAVLMCKGVSNLKPPEAVGTITIVAFVFSWGILLAFFSMLAIEIINPGSIDTFPLLMPFIIGLLLMLLFAFCLYKKDRSDLAKENVLDIQPLAKNEEAPTGEDRVFVLTKEVVDLDPPEQT